MWPYLLGLGVVAVCARFPSRSDANRQTYYTIPSHATVRIFRRHPHHAANVVIHRNHKHRPHAYDAYGNYRRG